jgi:hypothetical protein
LPQTEEQRIEQDNREGKPDIDIDLNKGTETGPEAAENVMSKGPTTMKEE